MLNSSNFVLGSEIRNFGLLFAHYIQVNHFCCVANGTDAIELALQALGLQPGDKIATVANASMYSCTSIIAIGGIPIFMDKGIIGHPFYGIFLLSFEHPYQYRQKQQHQAILACERLLHFMLLTN